jgi:hypothetical protein
VFFFTESPNRFFSRTACCSCRLSLSIPIYPRCLLQHFPKLRKTSYSLNTITSSTPVSLAVFLFPHKISSPSTQICNSLYPNQASGIPFSYQPPPFSIAANLPSLSPSAIPGNQIDQNRCRQSPSLKHTVTSSEAPRCPFLKRRARSTIAQVQSSTCRPCLRVYTARRLVGRCCPRQARWLGLSHASLVPSPAEPTPVASARAGESVAKLLAGAAAWPGAAERLGVQTPAPRSGMEVGSSRCARGRAVELLLARPPSAFQPRSLVRPPLLFPGEPLQISPASELPQRAQPHLRTTPLARSSRAMAMAILSYPSSILSVLSRGGRKPK